VGGGDCGGESGVYLPPGRKRERDAIVDGGIGVDPAWVDDV